MRWFVVSLRIYLKLCSSREGLVEGLLVGLRLLIDPLVGLLEEFNR
jgi:hypothetical protein